jgi:hypothetical protein
LAAVEEHLAFKLEVTTSHDAEKQLETAEAALETTMQKPETKLETAGILFLRWVTWVIGTGGSTMASFVKGKIFELLMFTWGVEMVPTILTSCWEEGTIGQMGTIFVVTVDGISLLVKGNV